jgi:transcription elongation factor GreA
MAGVPITRAGYERLSEELRYLQRVALPEVIQAIGTAREFGDISENAEFHAAKERQGLIMAKNADLQIKIGQCQVMEPPRPQGRAVFGCAVTVLDLDQDEAYTYKLVGPFESNLDQGELSTASPIGQALLGKGVGDEVRVKTPNGLRTLEITEIA